MLFINNALIFIRVKLFGTTPFSVSLIFSIIFLIESRRMVIFLLVYNNGLRFLLIHLGD
jgi:hypothetical protein